MKLHFLGGANEVGASSTLLETDNKKILVDAGIRMGSVDDPLPDLQALQDLGGPDLILITHAHADHIGALPLIHLAYPTVPLITTVPTKALMEILLGDALKIMNIKWEKEEDIPLYPPHAVEGLLSRIQTVEINQEVPILDGSFTAHFTPCGHVLGACSISLETPEGHIFFAGDYSLDHQKTVEGFKPPKLRPHVVITESTYGNRLHANRNKEEERLLETVNQIVSQGGKVLIPAFALGRAQEVLLILLDAKKEGRLENVPIYVDGLVRRICGTYQDHLPFLTKKLAKQIQKEGNPFFGEDKAVAVIPSKREEIAGGPPCIIVSSSGMLTGGPSAFYASHMVKKPENAILITGYQDEESPGRALLNLAEQVRKKGHGTLRIANETVEVACQVKRYGLSAHADAGQMASVVSQLQPRHAVLVHGDQEARPALARMLPASLGIHLPKNGETLCWKSFRKKARAKTSASSPKPMGEGKPLDPAIFYQKLAAQNHVGSRFTLPELDRMWHGATTPQSLEELQQVLPGNPGFEFDVRRPDLVRILPIKAPKNSVLNISQVVEFVTNLFKDEENFHKTSNKQAQRLLYLHFYFPEKAQGAHDEKIDTITSHTGWTVAISQRPHLQKLTDAATSLLPKEVEVFKTSVFPDQPRVLVKHKSILSPDLQSELSATYFQQTGRHLDFQSILQPAAPVPTSPDNGNGPLEINQALQIVRRAFNEQNVELYRCGRKEATSGSPYIEVALISPQVAQRYLDLLRQLEQETGWSIQYRPQPNPIAIIEVVKNLVPPAWKLKKQPGFHQNENYVKIKIEQFPSKPEQQRIQREVLHATGYQLEITR